MPHYPTSFNNTGISSTFNNVVTRRLAFRDTVAFGASSRFGGQQIESKNALNPWGGTIISAQGAISQLLQEFNLAQTLIPDLGNTTLLSYVGLATNSIGAAANVSAFSTTATIDGVAPGSNRVLLYGLTTSALNGVYTVSSNVWTRSADLSNWWQFTKPKAFLANQGTTNKANVFYLNTDAFETGNSFLLAPASATTGLTTYTGIAFTSTNTPGLTNVYQGGFSTSLINNDYNGTYVVGEYSFLAQDSEAKFIYLRNRARRMAYQVFKLRENYTPYATGTAAGNNIIGATYQTNTTNTGIEANNIGYSTANNLPRPSIYPSSFNRGF